MSEARVKDYRRIMKDTNSTYQEIVRAFTEAYMLLEKNHQEQKLLVIQLETAIKAKDLK